MEQQMDTLKVYKHVQHARLQNEDEMWISSEDLRTEGSSDEDTPHHKGHRSNKNKKLKNSASILNASKDTSSAVPKYSDYAGSSTKEACSSSYEKLTCQIEKSVVDQSGVITVDRCSVTQTKYSTDTFLEGAPSTSGISLGSSDADMDALNLESRWRPKRGSLKYPILVEGQTTENYIHEVNGFYNEMMCKIKSLKNCPAIRNLRQNQIMDGAESKLLKNLKDTPAVKEKIKFIEKLDNEIKETIQTYKAERSERLQTQDEMCNEIYRNKSFTERDAQMFLELCHFESSDDGDTVDIKESPDASVNKTGTEKQQNLDLANTFIKRNIELAKEGVMAGCSLTDEEKRALEDLLTDIDGDEDNQESKQYISTDISMEMEDDDCDDDNCYFPNAYIINDDDKRRIEDIDSELEKFKLDETDKEKTEQSSVRIGQGDWKDVLLEQRLKTINAKLDEFHERRENDKKNSAAASAENVDNSGSECSDAEQP